MPGVYHSLSNLLNPSTSWVYEQTSGCEGWRFYNHKRHLAHATVLRALVFLARFAWGFGRGRLPSGEVKARPWETGLPRPYPRCLHEHINIPFPPLLYLGELLGNPCANTGNISLQTAAVSPKENVPMDISPPQNVSLSQRRQSLLRSPAFFRGPGLIRISWILMCACGKCGHYGTAR